MEANFTANDLMARVAGALEDRDSARLAELTRAASLVAAEKTAMEAEQKRLAKKYGANSSQAAEASGRLAALEEQHASLAADVIRAGTPTPALEAGTFVVYGRVLDAQGNGVSGAKVVATDASGSSLATATSKSKGLFELRVPLQSRKKTIKKQGQEEDQAAETPVSFHLVVTARHQERPYTSPEILTAVSGRLAYREINLL